MTQLTPLRFLERSLEVCPDKVAVVHYDVRMTFRDLATEATQLAGALLARGLRPGDRVAYLCRNLPELVVAHFAIPLAGGVLVAINTRLASAEIGFILGHSRARFVFLDSALAAQAEPALGGLSELPQVITIARPDGVGPALGDDYSVFRDSGAGTQVSWTVPDEFAPISINYTSGTTGRPKGVVYTHRGAYLAALGAIVHSEHTADSVYLWTLPMFHCNGWCTPWALVAIGGRQVCLEAVRADRIWELVHSEAITHLNGAPTVLSMIVNAEQARPLTRALTITTAGAPPSPTIIAQLEELGARLIHVYGLTETYGPYSVCEYQDDWRNLDVQARARLLARQGVGMIQAERLRVVDDDLNDVPADGGTLGELVMRGNNVMAGYFDDEKATADAFRGGWFHSGDLGVMHSDGYVELRDRAKDIIISGGENISTVEVEQALARHPAVLEAAVVGVPDASWGERPVAYVVPRSEQPSEDELINHVRSLLAHFKAPDSIEFVEQLPKTATGKVQKFALREQASESRKPA